jgi:hypothetical protein
MPKFYRKELPDTPIVINGERLKFAFLKCEDGDPRIKALDECVRKKVGGVIAVESEEAHQEWLKKKAQRKPSLSGFKREEVKEKSFPQGKGEVARYAVKEETPAQAEPVGVGAAVDFTKFKPTTARGVF